MYAIMYAAASRGKGKNGKLPKPDELYKRPTDEDIAKSRVENVLEKQAQAQEWLAQFDLSKLYGKEDEAK